MEMSDAQAWAVIIGTAFAGIASIVGIIKTGKVEKKTDRVHELVNSRATQQDKKIDDLQLLLGLKQLELDANERTRLALASATTPLIAAIIPLADPVKAPPTIVDSHGTAVSSEVT
jgi:hypothetical protein